MNLLVLYNTNHRIKYSGVYCKTNGAGQWKSKPNPFIKISKLYLEAGVGVHTGRRLGRVMEEGGGGDHGGVVSTISQGRNKSFNIYRRIPDFIPQPFIGGHAAGQKHRFGPDFDGRLESFVHQNICRRLLKLFSQQGHLFW